MMLNQKKENIIYGIYLTFIFSVLLVFYTRAEPIMISDPDDWTYISTLRKAYPIWGGWNPAKVLPETFMGLCGYFAAYCIYPIVKDYTMSMTYVYAVVTSAVIALYMLCIAHMVKKIFALNAIKSICISFLSFLLHFLFLNSNEDRNWFFFKASNLNCLMNYTIPLLLNMILAMYLIVTFAYSKNTLLLGGSFWKCENNKNKYLKTGIFVLGIYLAIFSNMVCNIALVAPCIYMFINTIWSQAKERGIKEVLRINNLKGYAFYVYVFVSELVCLVFESQGGRASDLVVDWGVAFKNIKDDIIVVCQQVNHQYLIACIVVIIGGIFIYVTEKEKDLHSKLYLSIFKIGCFGFGLSAIYTLLLYTRIGYHKLIRCESVFPIFIYFNILALVSLAYILSKIEKLYIVLPLVTYIMVISTVSGDYLPCLSGYSDNAYNCHAVNENIVHQFIDADRQGLSEFDLHIDDNVLGSYSFSGERIARTLYRHGVVSRKMKVNLILEPLSYFIDQIN